MGNVFALGIEVVDDDVGVALVGGSEDDDFEVLVEVLKEVVHVGSDVDGGLEGGNGLGLRPCAGRRRR